MADGQQWSTSQRAHPLAYRYQLIFHHFPDPNQVAYAQQLQHRRQFVSCQKSTQTGLFGKTIYILFIITWALLTSSASTIFKKLTNY